MALSELPPALDDGEDAGSELPLMRAASPGAMSRAWVARLAGVDAPWSDARRERRAQATGLDMSPIVLTSAKGANVVDIDGNRYVDLVAAFGACLVGHAHPRLLRTLEMQSSRLMYGLGDVYPSDAKIGLTERLARLFPEPSARVLLGLSGADAIDAAIKTALLATGKPGVLAFEGAYHGLATGPLATCGLRPEFREPFAPHLSPHVGFAPYPAEASALERSLAAVDAALAKGDVGAVIVEPVLGRGGVVVPPDGFLTGLREICTRRSALLVADEIWTGLGRCGALLRTLDQGVVPDIVCLGKGLGGGLPLSACIGRASVMEAWRTPKCLQNKDEASAYDGPAGEAIHTSTHAGNPLACSMAIALLDTVVGTKLADRAKESGASLVASLKDRFSGGASGVRAVRGVGLMVGIEVEGGAARGLALARECLHRGYLVLTGGAGDVITLTPPLNVSKVLLDAFVDTFAELASTRSV